MYAFHGNYAPVPPSNFCVPPPPIPPPVFIQPWLSPQQADQEFVRSFEKRLKKEAEYRGPKIVSISDAREKITNLVLSLDDIKKTEKTLRENIETLPEEEWNMQMQEVGAKKLRIKNALFGIGGSFLDQMKKLLAKRLSKRLRLKRVKLERRNEKKELIKQLQERSRKIDENLKKIQDDFLKAKQEAEEKLHADAVLKDVLRKKSDARKCIAKLDGLMTLRKARVKTAKGRGDSVNMSEMIAFKNNIDKLKLLWTKKLELYEKEESELRATLKQGTEQKEVLMETDNDIITDLKMWRQQLFGDCLPQANFNGDVNKFIATRTKWDKFVCSEGSALPVGWVIPKLED
ncbi:unnamed protein product, partial [Iphiclides podalirius]